MTKVATTGVIQHEGKILIGQRRRDGRWELPGGKVDPDETPAECICREIKEELNLDVTVVRSLGEVEGVYRDIPMRVFAFLLRVTGGRLVQNVHLETHWVAPDHINEFDVVEEDREVLQRLKVND